MDVILSGSAISLRQASHAASTMASWFSKTAFETQF
jgi:hypothetical protein